MLKSGAVQVEKCSNKSNEIAPEVREEQSRFILGVERSKSNAKDIEDLSPRRRFLDHWMIITLEAIDVLVEICDRLIPELIHDLEVNYGIKIMRRISEDIRSTIQPFVPKEQVEVETTRKGTSRTLCDTLFPEHQQGWNQAYQALVALQGLQMYLGHVHGLLVALAPTSQAMWDGAFNKAVVSSQTQVERQMSWVKQQIAVRSPQTLLVPSHFNGDGNSDGPAIVRG